jgi:hypothetical protein
MRSIALLFPFALAAAAPLAAAETVPVESFRQVELRGGGNVVLRPGAAERVTILEGSSQFTTFRVDGEGRLVIDACNDRCPRHYKLRIEIQVPKVVPSAVKGGGTITAAPGFARQREIGIAVDGGGLIDMRAVSAVTVAAAVTGGGKILSGVSDTLAAAVMGGGEIRYLGDPKTAISINGGGNVRRGN